VQTATDGRSAIEVAAAEPPDVIVLDLGLPDFDRVEVCARIREWSAVPITVLSAGGADDRKVAALDAGADDYITKPFSTPELLARVRVALRHAKAGAAARAEPSVLRVGDIEFDLPHHRASVAGRALELTPKEFDFLAFLASHPGRVLTHRTVLQAVWGADYGTETHPLRVYASQLRKKLGEDPDRPRLVTEPGVGYRLVDPSTGD